MNILQAACLGGNIQLVKYVLSQNNLDINIRMPCWKTPLMLAAENGHNDVVELLVDKGADVSLKVKTGDNVLHIACYGGHLDVVKYLLSLNSIKINRRGRKKMTPVMVAASQGHKEVVELLVKRGADLSLRAQMGSILHTACSRGHFDVVKYLLSLNSVDINSRGVSNRTPVMVAAYEGHKDVVELLVKHGADMSLTSRFGNNILYLACEQGYSDIVKYLLSLKCVDINSRGVSNRTPVMVAAYEGHKDVVELLVKHGADMSLTSRFGNNILYLACEQGYSDIVKYLLSLKCVDINSRGVSNRTPVMVAAYEGHKDVVELLVKHRADMSLTTRFGNNILYLACEQGYSDIVKYLLSLKCVDINIRGWNQRTPVTVAAYKGHKKVVELLVKHGADLSLATAKGNSILHMACSQGEYDVVKYLVALNSVDINSRGNKQMTPVMLAAEKGYKNVVQLLVDNGARLPLKDNDGKTLLT
ncbi:ankyrin repeat domain-containing protein 50-like [Haliotis asinina]|uniref:ankyrin repeat domain-containing protein 50-like n=1 Tax=Haliotis asinina TaxID=109174 RepID=UPI0035326DF0